MTDEVGFVLLIQAPGMLDANTLNRTFILTAGENPTDVEVVWLLEVTCRQLNS
ncbi:MAG TPA: hypothetical protein VK712_02640 [Verrucomicrobiae bacterium]|nr:hypothetical protein [Verrucomicrobiae bacterium]